MSWLLYCVCLSMEMECSTELVRGKLKEQKWDYGNLLATSSNKNFTIHKELWMFNIGKRGDDGKTNLHDHDLWMDPHGMASQAVTYKLNSFRHVGYPRTWKENIPFWSTLLLMINTEPTGIILRPKKSSTTLHLPWFCYAAPSSNFPTFKVKVKQSHYRPGVAQRVPGS
jgi:hypothetical protein